MIDDRPTFSTRTIAWVIVAGVIAFGAFLWLSAYAPQIRMRNNGGVHPLSKSAVGFYGLYALEDSLGDRSVALATTKDDWLHKGLMIVCIAPNTDPADLRQLVRARLQHGNNSTLYILPKWQTLALPGHAGWVAQSGTIAPSMLAPLLRKIGKVDLVGETSTPPPARDTPPAGATPNQMRWLSGAIEPIIDDDKGHAILARVVQPPDGRFSNGAVSYILADPDLLSNAALKSAMGAATALRIIRQLRPDMQSDLTFDMVLNGMGNDRNLLQLMFEPPFLALTLSVLAAGLLVGLHAFGRFGPALPEPRAIPFGKRALADNAATLIARANAEKRLGDRYVGLTRDAAALSLGASALAPDALEEWLAGLPTPDGDDFGTLANAARSAKTVTAMRDAAQRLFDWKRIVTRER